VIRMKLAVEEMSPSERRKLLRDFDDLKLRLMEIKMSMELTSSDEAAEREYADPALLDGVTESILKPGTSIIEYFVGKESSYAWLIQQNMITMRELPDVATGYPPASLFVDLLSQEEEQPYLSVGARLYRDLIAPFEDDLRGSQLLIIVPDDVLNYLPFENLPAGTESGAPGEPHFLVERYNISYAPSLSILLHLMVDHSSGSQASGGILAVGDPIEERPGGPWERFYGMFTGTPEQESETTFMKLEEECFPRLKKTGDEVRRIMKFFPESRRTLLLGTEANEAAFREKCLDRYQVIHFATHGIYDDYNPELSGLVLSNSSRGEDGFLLVDEITKLDLNCSLVVLSGCQTGVGKYIRGEGIVGLSRAFLSSGASTVVASLWEIGDESTADFMEEFYRGFTGGLGKSEALASAKRHMIEKGRNYRCWAPFILIGDYR
jgi:CHAT domain-containing protein